MTISAISFVGEAPSAPQPVNFRKAAPADPASFLPDDAKVRLSLLRMAKANAESAITNAREADVPAALMGDLNAERAAAASNLMAVETYLETLRSPATALAPANVKGQTLEGVRAAIEEAEGRMTALQLQKPVRAEQIERLTTMVKATAATGAPQSHLLARESWNSADPATALRQIMNASGDAVSLLCYVAGDDVIAKVSATIPADPDGSLPKAERMEAIAQCRQALLDAGWIEETLIRQAATPPLRRHNALAEPLLGVVAR